MVVCWSHRLKYLARRIPAVPRLTALQSAHPLRKVELLGNAADIRPGGSVTSTLYFGNTVQKGCARVSGRRRGRRTPSVLGHSYERRCEEGRYKGGNGELTTVVVVTPGIDR